MAGKNLYAPLAAMVVFEMASNGLIAQLAQDLTSIAMSGGEEHQLAPDEFQEELQRRAKAKYAYHSARAGQTRF